MQKNWYAVYTKPNCEKEVVSFFSRKKIENFCPMNRVKIQSFRHSKILQEPLFKSYVFVNIDRDDTFLLKQAEGVISLLYWKGKPLIIREDEIAAIKEFITDHNNIELEKTQINLSDIATIEETSYYSKDGKVDALKNDTVKVNLPSLGYAMCAGRKAFLQGK